MLTEKIKLVEGEKIVLTVRKHWFILVSQTFSLIILGIVPALLLFFAISGSNNLNLSVITGLNNINDLVLFFSAAWFLIIWMMIFGVWTDYYLDMWTITTKRVIAINQRGFFHRSIASFRLERMQDLNIHINGIIATALDFGTIEAETASHDDSFVIKGAPKPRDIKSVIQHAADELTAQRSQHHDHSDDGV